MHINRLIPIPFFMVAALSQSAFAGSVEKVECRGDGCRVTCQSNDQKPVVYGPASEIEIEYMASGATINPADKNT